MHRIVELYVLGMREKYSKKRDSILPANLNKVYVHRFIICFYSKNCACIWIVFLSIINNIVSELNVM